MIQYAAGLPITPATALETTFGCHHSGKPKRGSYRAASRHSEETGSGFFKRMGLMAGGS